MKYKPSLLATMSEEELEDLRRQSAWFMGRMLQATRVVVLQCTVKRVFEDPVSDQLALQQFNVVSQSYIAESAEASHAPHASLWSQEVCGGGGGINGNVP